MILDDFKDKFITEGRAVWDKVQDSAAFNQLRDRYENLTPTMQKVTLLGSVGLIAMLFLSVPYSNFSQSTVSVEEFEGKRDTIRELLKVSREASEMPNIPSAPPAQMIRSRVEEEIKNARLLPEQIKGTNSAPTKSSLIPDNLIESGLEIRLAKLNLRQVVDLGYKFQSISPSVKMKDMVVTANIEDNRYFDVLYQLVSLAVPTPPEPPAEEPIAPKGKSKKQPKKDAEE